MVELLDRLTSMEGIRPTALESVKLLRANHSCPRTPVLYEPSIVIVAQGRKRGYLGGQTFTYDAHNYLVLTVPLPFECETQIGKDGPLLGLTIRVDLAVLSELVMQMEPRTRTTHIDGREPSVSATPLDAMLVDATIRLLESLSTPGDAKILGPQIVREIIYRVLCGKRGGALQALLVMGGTRAQILHILHRIHSDYAHSLDVAALAGEAGMSVSALHHHFKEVTATSPLRYLKTIRLHKARMLMVQEGVGAAIAAERVGYESPSQFSREFKRLFGAPPVDEADRVRAMLGTTRTLTALVG
jgi:AraC-like DNA-binding protein